MIFNKTKFGFSSSSPINTRASAFRILVIDDEPDVLDAVRLNLRKTGWSISATSNPKEGFELAMAFQPSVILCDASMPVLSGPQVIQMLKDEPATAHIPVVLMTGIAEAFMFEKVPWTGFLAKPFAPAELRDAICSASVKWQQ